MKMRSAAGFTLIELMIALVVSSLLVGMILAIFSRMSISYRGQQQIAGVQQVLAAARATIELDAKQAGLETSQGFRIANDAVLRMPVNVVNSAVGPDQIAFFYADTTTQALVTDKTQFTSGGALTVDSATGFSPTATPLVVMVNINTSTANGALAGLSSNDAVVTDFDACVLQLTSVSGNQLRFSTAAPWGSAGESHCSGVVPAANQTMVFNFVAHAYRIDTSTPARAMLGPLQLSTTGGVLGNANDNWTDLAYGFTDIQVATRMYQASGVLVDSDGDGDANRNWFSSANQNAFSLNLPTDTTPLQMSISLVARTDRDIEGIATAQTPALIDTTRPLANNAIGDRPSVALPSATDDLLKGPRIYRYITFRVDFRNLGVGR